MSNVLFPLSTPFPSILFSPLFSPLFPSSQVFESFPSGDAAGAAVFSACAALVTDHAYPAVWLCAAMSAFGRLYVPSYHGLHKIHDLFGGEFISIHLKR